ncbi:MAG: OadG family protein [Hydrogenoanaerobacterium sp.]
MDFELAGTVILSGLLIVFLVLILLTFLVMLFGKIMGSTGNGKKKDNSVAEKAQPMAQIVQPQPAPQGTDGAVSDEIVAVISASVAAVFGGGFEVKSVRRAPAKGTRSAWCMAGMQHNTDPF